MVMPSSLRRIPIGISFDAQDTLVDVIGSIGQRYKEQLCRFLAKHDIALEEAVPSCTEDHLQAVVLEQLHHMVNQEREVWIAAHPEAKHRKEMLIGGCTEVSNVEFWCKCVDNVFHTPSLLARTASAEKKTEILNLMHSAEWHSFLLEVLDHFATSDCYAWLPEGLRTLTELQRWNMEQERKRGGAVKDTSAILVLAAPPFIVTNSDFRMRAVLKSLGAFDVDSSTDAKVGRPLLGTVVTAAEIGYAKPSPKGILHCIRECGVEPQHFIHVGDSEDDEMASQAAGCRFLLCQVKVGIRWEKLKAVLEEMEREVQAHL